VEPRITAARRFAGNYAPRLALQRIRLGQAITWRRGDAIERTKLKHDCDGWELSTGLMNSLSLSHVLGQLLARLGGFEQEIRSLCAETSIEPEISCAIYARDGQPEITLSAEILHKLVELGVTLDIDIL